VEKSFLYQMSDMLTISGVDDSGGESLLMPVLTEDEANAADAEDWNSRLAYGASEEDLVTFLQVRSLLFSRGGVTGCTGDLRGGKALHLKWRQEE